MVSSPRSIATRRDLLLGLGAAALPLGRSAVAAPPPVLEAKPVGQALAYNAMVPGPLLRLRKGERLKLRLADGLAAPTSVTWHGVRPPAAMDGVVGLTQPAVAPGGGFDVDFVPPDSGTFWYHPHVPGGTAAQVAAGLWGVLIVDEPEPPAVDGDWLVALSDPPPDAKTPDALLVGGRPSPERREARPGGRLRLRLVNACVSRIAVVAVTGATPSVIALDGQPSELFQPAAGTVPLGPGQRCDLMLDMPGAVGATVALVLRGLAGAADRPLTEIKVTGVPAVKRDPIAKLPENAALPTRIALERAKRAELVIAAAGPRWTIGGVDGAKAVKPLFSVKRGTPVSLTLRNTSADPQTIHVHGHCWRLLHDLDDGWDPYWRDSVLLPPGKVKHVAFVADNPGRWALCSSDLRRLDGGLSTWFEVA